MYGLNRNDDYLGNDELNNSDNTKTIVLPGKNLNTQDWVEKELLRIVAINKQCNLANNPELMGSLLDDLKKKIKKGDIMEIIRDPIVYSSISVVLLAIILYKISKKRKK
jgi:hypothetical protein